MMARIFLALVVIPLALAKVQFLGINIAGFDFGCQIDGTCTTGSVSPPLTTLGGADGAGQMQHFVGDDQMNIFRMPVSWQFLVNNNLGSSLDATNLGKYDQLIQACLATGAMCAIDIHNFARFNGEIIGQGGPTDAQFADLWSQLATKYQSNSKVIFGLMNEPHDLDVPTWANSCQAAVTAIRNAGATSQMILLPGTNFASAGQFISSGSGVALTGIKNPDGSTTGLILDLHKYLDVDNSGEHATCTTDNIADAFSPVADFLRQNGRQAIVSETGAGSDASCFTDFCSQNTFLNQNSDVFLGYIAWAAGSFATNYVLSLTPTKKNNKFVDNALMSQCVLAPWLNAAAASIQQSILPTTTSTSYMTLTATLSVTGGVQTVTTTSFLGGSVAASTTEVGAAIPTSNSIVNGSLAFSTSSPSNPTFTSILSTGAADEKRVGASLMAGTILCAFVLSLL